MPEEQFGHREPVTGRAAWWGKRTGGALAIALIIYVVVTLVNAPPNKDRNLYLEYKLEREVARICKNGDRVWRWNGRLWVMATRPGTWMDAQVATQNPAEVCE